MTIRRIVEKRRRREREKQREWSETKILVWSSVRFFNLNFIERSKVHSLLIQNNIYLRLYTATRAHNDARLSVWRWQCVRAERVFTIAHLCVDEKNIGHRPNISPSPLRFGSHQRSHTVFAPFLHNRTRARHQTSTAKVLLCLYSILLKRSSIRPPQRIPN